MELLDLKVFNLKIYIFVTIFYTIIGLCFNEIFRKFPKSVLLAYCVSFLFLIPVSIIDWKVFDWLMWLKAYFLIPLIFLTLWARIRGINSNMKLWLLILLDLNILLVAIKLFSAGSVANIINGVSALILIATAPSKNLIFLSPSEKSKAPDLLWDAPYAWIFAYTAWEIAFVFSLFPDAITLQSFFLLAPLLMMLKDKKLYMQTRMSTLSFFLLAGLIIPPFRKPQMIETLKNESLATTLSVGLLAIFIGYNLYTSKGKIRKFIDSRLLRKKGIN